MQSPAICVYLWLWTQSEIYGEHLLVTTHPGSVEMIVEMA